MSRFADIFACAKEEFGVWLMRTIAVVILLLLFFVTLGGVSQNDRWRISDITISGANVVVSEDVRARVSERLLGNYYFVYSRENSYLFPRSEIEETLLEAFPRLSTASVRRVYDKTITIEVTERKPFALWCGEEYNKEMDELNDCWFIDDTGFVFDRAPIFSEGVYLEVYGGILGVENESILGGRIVRDSFVLAHTFQNIIKKEVGIPLRIKIKPDGEYGVTVQSSQTYPVLAGVELRFKGGQDPNILLKNIIAALPAQFPVGVIQVKKLEYIDLRFNKRVIFGFEK